MRCAIAVGYINSATVSGGQLVSAGFLKPGSSGFNVSGIAMSGYQEDTAFVDNNDYTCEFYILDDAGRTNMAIASGKTDTNGQILDGSPVNFTRPDGEVAVGANAYYYELVVSDDNKYVYFSSTAGAAAQDTGKNATLKTTSAASANLRDDTGKAAYGNAGWYAVASVPEPTSGLLLLLGVAGLAHTCSHFASQSSGYALG